MSNEIKEIIWMSYKLAVTVNILETLPNSRFFFFVSTLNHLTSV